MVIFSVQHVGIPLLEAGHYGSNLCFDTPSITNSTYQMLLLLQGILLSSLQLALRQWADGPEDIPGWHAFCSTYSAPTISNSLTSLWLTGVLQPSLYEMHLMNLWNLWKKRVTDGSGMKPCAALSNRTWYWYCGCALGHRQPALDKQLQLSNF